MTYRCRDRNHTWIQDRRSPSRPSAAKMGDAMSKNGLSIDGRRELGVLLKRTRSDPMERSVKVGNSCPDGSLQEKEIGTLPKAIDHAKDKLDSLVLGEHPKDAEPSIHYGTNSGRGGDASEIRDTPASRPGFSTMPDRPNLEVCAGRPKRTAHRPTSIGKGRANGFALQSCRVSFFSCPISPSCILRPRSRVECSLEPSDRDRHREGRRDHGRVDLPGSGWKESVEGRTWFVLQPEPTMQHRRSALPCPAAPRSRRSLGAGPAPALEIRHRSAHPPGTASACDLPWLPLLHWARRPECPAGAGGTGLERRSIPRRKQVCRNRRIDGTRVVAVETRRIGFPHFADQDRIEVGITVGCGAWSAMRSDVRGVRRTTTPPHGRSDLTGLGMRYGARRGRQGARRRERRVFRDGPELRANPAQGVMLAAARAAARRTVDGSRGEPGSCRYPIQGRIDTGRPNRDSCLRSVADAVRGRHLRTGGPSAATRFGAALCRLIAVRRQAWSG